MGDNQPTEHLQIQKQTEPKTYKVRILLIGPTLPDLAKAAKELEKFGVPKKAELHFHQWNTPDNNYYIIATWYD